MDIEAIEQFACAECIEDLPGSPYIFMGKNFSKANYNYIRDWLKHRGLSHLIRFDYTSCLKSNEFAKLYCPKHNESGYKIEYIHCAECKYMYGCVNYMIGYKRMFARSLPSHICDTNGMCEFLESLEIENSSDKIKSNIFAHLFPNRSKSAANI